MIIRKASDERFDVLRAREFEMVPTCSHKTSKPTVSLPATVTRVGTHSFDLGELDVTVQEHLVSQRQDGVKILAMDMITTRSSNETRHHEFSIEDRTDFVNSAEHVLLSACRDRGNGNKRYLILWECTFSARNHYPVAARPTWYGILPGRTVHHGHQTRLQRRTRRDEALSELRQRRGG